MEKEIQEAKILYESQRKIYCPYFKQEITLNSDGFHHLQFTDRRSRNMDEQLLKFKLLPLALETIRKSGTLQEYRKTMDTVGHVGNDGFRSMKIIEYWAFVAIVGKHQTKIRTILRKVGNGNIIFWSVMPIIKFRKGEQPHNLANLNIEDE